MNFTRLRLSGFKTFVDPTELHIEPGLTGVVGPNGCGKSNLLEAVRWVMGESSYKSLRGSTMEDVIFSGSADRPARNTAEVTIQLDNSERQAPSQFNEHDVIEVSRRIEREAGSAYRINGREARARDVQMLFADASTGAHSIALVRQGQIGELIAAKPQDRRRILEEAAGISGLHHRRHEAELRLRAADQNLARLDDVIGEIDNQLQALKRQARHAGRYRKVAAEIRKAEALLLHLRWTDAGGALGAAVKEREQAREVVQNLTGAAAVAAREEAEAAEVLTPLRQDEAEAAAALTRLRTEDRSLAEAAERVVERQRELEARLAHTVQDLERERAILVDNDSQLAALAAEETEVRKAEEGAGEAEEAATAKVAEARAALEAAEAALAGASAEMIELKSAHATHHTRIAEAEDRVARFEAEIAEASAEAERLEAEEAGDVAPLRAAAEEAQGLLGDIDGKLAEATAGLEVARSGVVSRREALAAAQRELDRLEAEAAALSAVAATGGEGADRLVEAVNVVAGYETALSAALGDDLEVSLASDAKVRWRALEPVAMAEGLPEGAEPLGLYVSGPPALDRRLAYIGVVGAAEGDLLQRLLKPGQRLVSREGDLWRWDGLIARAGAETAASRRLQARNRLQAMAAEIETASGARGAAAEAAQAAAAEAKQAEAHEARTRQAWRDAGQALQDVRARLADAEEASRTAREARTALAERRARLAADLEEARRGLAEAGEMASALASPQELEEKAEPLRVKVREGRSRLAGAEAAAAGLAREAAERKARIERLRFDMQRWQGRAEDARRQEAALTARQSEADEALAELADQPQAIAAKRGVLADAVGKAEEARKVAADRLAAAEAALAEKHKHARELELALSEARSTMARAEARTEAAEERREEAERAIADALQCRPEEARELAEIAEDKPLPSGADTEERLQKLRGERERLGAVNLRAEDEAAELEDRVAEMRSEREDLEKAIRRLRQGISSLNTEARGRLTAAFDEVGDHFRELFKTLFGGGTAELSMTESEDPLEAGLEVIAKPPGKRPQTLTLLSGGEQALTAIALILAVFRTNPSPICVLDEVDAPLDDANVERFCNLIETLADTSATRFLIITHHPYTMARMDRLFGVTMGERGVSQLVSVDLEAAERFREAG